MPQIGTAGVSDPGEGHINLLAPLYAAIIQGAWDFYINASQWLNGFILNNPPAQNDELNYKAYLAAGTYVAKLIYAKNSSAGIITITIDTQLVLTVDTYAAGATFNQIATSVPFTITASGVKTIKIKVPDKNASASTYQAYITSLTFYRTA